MLSGIRVLDFTNQLGWIAGRILADLGADVVKVEPPDLDITDSAWQAHNLNKRSLALDITTKAGEEAVFALAPFADILLQTALPGSSEAEFFDESGFREKNLHLIQVSITPFGRGGPRSCWLANDLELMAASGAMSLAGEAEGMPVRISSPQSGGWAGVAAATGALTALKARERTGRGQLVDVSAQAAIIAALANAPTFYDLEGTVPTRAGAFVTGRSVEGARYRVFWPCQDGYINFILYGGIAGRRTNQALVDWICEDGEEPGVLTKINWDHFSPTELTQNEVDAIEEPIGRFMRRLTKREFLDGACARDMLGYPVSTVADIAADPQLEARAFWSDQTDLDGNTRRYCGSFGVVDGQRLPIRQPTGRSVTLAELIEAPNVPRGGAEGSEKVPPATDEARALGGVKVAVFGGYAAGPWIGKLLANFGAVVVHVESADRPDGFRMEYPPFKDDEPGVNRGGTFAFFNDSKLAVTLDIKKPGGVRLARRLVDWCDIVIENMRPGVMARLGLGYETLIETNPDLIQLSTCNMGQTGPRARTPGFGSQLSAMAGFCELAGEPAGSPMLLYGPYIDFIAAFYGTSAALAALEQRRASGKGAQIDLSQYECGLSFLAGELLDFHAGGGIAKRRGNDDPAAAPHGAFLGSDGRWLVLSCWSDEEFRRLAHAVGEGSWAGEKRFATLSARQENASFLTEGINRWCSTRTAQETVSALQESRVHAYVVNTVADLFSDPQLLQRGTWRIRRHPVIGEQAYYFPGFDLSDNPGDVTTAGPLLGADNERVYRDFLGLTEGEIGQYRESGVIG